MFNLINTHTSIIVRTFNTLDEAMRALQAAAVPALFVIAPSNAI